ncbi:MAG: ABC transporter substrate-binding protein [Syntrophobacterales bacterium]|nr:ABC transporter substrate-binding protein [Syntrophobacterales bacterium]
MRAKLGLLFCLLAMSLITFLWLKHRRSPIPIGFIGPLTGRYSDLGVAGRNGVMLAIEDINAKGGINGRPIILIPEDDCGTVEGAKKAFERLQTSEVVAIVGPMISTSAIVLKPLIDEARLVTISPTVSSSMLLGQRDYVFRIISDNSIRAKGLARFALEILPPPSNPPRLWCFIYDNDNFIYSLDFVYNFSEVLVGVQDLTACHGAYSYKMGIDLDTVLDQIKVVKPDALVLAVSAIDGARILNWLKVNLPEVPAFSSAWMVSEELFRRLHHDEHATVFIEHIEPPEYSERTSEIQKRFEKRFGKKISFPAIYAYDATMILAKAIEKTGGDSKDLVSTLSSGITCDCLIGNISMDSFGDSIHPWWIYKLERGELKLIREERF